MINNQITIMFIIKMNTLILVINYKCECSVTEDESQHHKLTSLTVQWILKKYVLLYVHIIICIWTTRAPRTNNQWCSIVVFSMRLTRHCSVRCWPIFLTHLANRVQHFIIFAAFFIYQIVQSLLAKPQNASQHPL